MSQGNQLGQRWCVTGWRAVQAALLMSLVLFIAGCSTKSMQPGDLTRVQPLSDQPYAGNVYLLRGFIGIWSYGIDGLGAEINKAGVRATVYRNEQWEELTAAIIEKYKDAKVFEPLIIVGHSWGADHALMLAQKLEAARIPVDMVITLDPVTPPEVPANIRLCCNIYQPNGIFDAIPIFRGVPLKQVAGSKGTLKNLNIRADRKDLLEPDTDHYNIEKNVKIHREVVKQILGICPTRETWVRMHPEVKTMPEFHLPPKVAAIATPAKPAQNQQTIAAPKGTETRPAQAP